MDLNEALKLVLRTYKPEFKVDSLRQHQLETLTHIWEDKGDLLLCVPTGYGKSLIYQIAAPLLRLRDNRETGSVIVISPLNMIHLDQLIAMKKYGIKCCKLDIEGKAQICSRDAGFVGENRTENAVDYTCDDQDNNTDLVILTM